MMVAKPYLDKQSGQTKTKWVKIGSAVEMAGNDGQMKTFGDVDALPTGGWWDGSFQLFEADQQQGQQPQQNNYNTNQQQPQPAYDLSANGGYGNRQR